MNKSQMIYDYLLENCIGYENRIKGYELMKLFDINDNKTLRSYIQETRKKDEYKYLVGSEAGFKGGYWIVNNAIEKKKTVKHLLLRAIEQLKMLKTIKRKEIYNEKYRYAERLV